MEKLEQKGDVTAPTVAPAPVPVSVGSPTDRSEEKHVVQSDEDRLAELRRKSEATKQNASRIESSPEVKPVSSGLEASVSDLATTPEEVSANLSDTALEASAPEKIPKNVFAKIETKIAPKQDRRRSRRRMDKKGGGRQKQEKKLNRQKYLEYKYEAKDILNDPNVPEEHRSNVLGQIWAKGERQGVDESLDYIESKEEELILPNNVADQLRELVKRMTTKR